MSSPHHPEAPSRTRRWLRRWPLLAIGLLAFAPGDRAVAPAPSAEASGGSSARAQLGPTARLTVELGASPTATVTLTVLSEGEPCASYSGALPAVLEVPRDRPLVLVAEAPGRARHVAELVLDQDRLVRVPLPPGAELSGRVLDDAGEPLAGAQITLVRDGGPQRPWITRTDAAGRFTIDTLLSGRYHVRASAPGHASLARDVDAGGEDLRLALERVGLVAGRVVGVDGSGAEGATVVIAGSGLWPARQTTADADGRFRLGDVPPGIYEVRASSGSLVAAPRRGLTVEPGAPVYLTLALAEGAVLRGIVRDSMSGEPVADAEVTASSEALDAAPAAARTDASGRFTIRGLLLQEGAARLSVFASGYVPRSAIEHTDLDEPLAIELEPGATIGGVVLDEHRQPIEGASIEVLGETNEQQPVALGAGVGFRSAVFAAQLEPATLPASPGALEVIAGPVPPIPLAPLGDELGEGLPIAPLPPSASELRASAGYLSDADGRFLVTGVPPGHVQVVARRAGRASDATPRLYVAAGSTRDDVELVLPPAGSLHAIVRDERGSGVEGVLVEARSDREPFPRVALTDDRGELTLDDVVGELTVTATPQGRPAVRASVSVQAGEHAEVTLALEGELHALRGRVVDEDGYPVASTQLSVVSLRADAPHRRTFFAAADGTFSLSDLPAPPWRVEASDPSYSPARVDVVSSEEDVRVVLARGARVSGRLLDDRTAEPVAARVTLTREILPVETLETRSGPDGGFELSRVRAGVWRMRVQTSDHLAFEQEVEVIDRGRGPDDLALDPIHLAAAGRLEGSVVDALGAPVAHARVEVEDGPHTETDARGEFVLRGLPAGTMVALASHPAAGEGSTGVVRILAGRETVGLVVHLSERFDPARAASLPGRRRGVAIVVGAARDGAARQVRVQEVVEDSYAARAGLRAGDVIETIDDVEPTSASHAARLLRGASGVPAILAVRRGDARAVLVVEREVWLPPI